MHNWGILIPIAIFTIGPITAAFNNWLRVRHGYEPEPWRGRRGRRLGPQDQPAGRMTTDELGAARKVELLTGENEKLTGQVSRLEERIRVLERIATDPAERTARAIDALRD